MPIQKLDVVLTLFDGEKILCGQIFAGSPDHRGQTQGSFRYTQNYLTHPGAFPLDPEHLPLIDKEFDPERPEGVHGVFEDALPDSWGRRIMVQKWKISRAEQRVFTLLEYQGASGIGALSFLGAKDPVPEVLSVKFLDLSTVVEAAMDYDAGKPVDDHCLSVLFTNGSSPPGGARPKALIDDENGVQWIAKFPKLDDKYEVERIEAATLQLARDAGIYIPEFKIADAGKRNVLLVKRFDVTEQGGRNHMISMQTILKADGFYYLSYSDLFAKVKKFSYRPQEDIAALFRQMVFNIAIGNTDDHLKNFCMFHTKNGLQLSPAYDLLPNINNNREHQLSFPQGAGSRTPGRDLLIRMGKLQKVFDPERIIDEVADSVFRWKDVFSEFEVPQNDIQRLSADIERRLKKIRF